MGGQPVDVLPVEPRGAEGDRAHAVYDEFRGHPRRLTAREAPRLLLWRAVYDDHGTVVVAGPDGRRHGWDDELAAALSEDLGRPVWLKHDAGLMQDLRDSLLVTFAASHRALEAEIGPLDPRRWRTNIEVEADVSSIPEQIEVSVEGLEVGSQIHASDVQLPEGTELKADPELLVCNVVPSPTEAQMEGETEAEGGAEEAPAASESADSES